MNTTTITPQEAQELYGIAATKRVIDNVAEVLKCLIDGIDIGDIRAIGNLGTIAANLPEGIKEASDYSSRELEELGKFCIEQFGEVLAVMKFTERRA